MRDRPKPPIGSFDVGPTGAMHKGDRARQQAPEYVKHARVSRKDTAKTPKDKD